MINEIADGYVATGEEPSIILVQSRIGAGGYTTVKRYLEVWKAERIKTKPAVVVPDDVSTRGNEFVRSLWTLATAQAEGQTRQAREEAAAQVAQSQTALAEAETTITQLEGEIEVQGQELATALRSIERLQSELVAAHGAQQVAEARAHEVEHRSEELRNELEQARNAERRVGRLEGETEALRRQVTDQQTMIERLTTRS